MSEPTRPRRRSATIVFVALLAPIAALTGAAQLAGSGWPADMVTFFRPHLAVAAILLALCAFATCRVVFIVVALAPLAVNVYPLVVTTVPAAENAEVADLRIVSANVLYDNPSKSRFQDMVASLAPDIMVTQEAIFAWPPVLANLAGYPYVAGPDVARWGGNIVVSRFPLSASLVALTTGFQTEIGYQALRVQVERPGGARLLIVYAIHAPTPRTRKGWEARNLYLGAIASHVRAEPAGTDVIVAGDWNTPVWSPVYARFFRVIGPLGD